EVDARVLLERAAHEAAQVDAAEVAAAIGRQRLLAARVGRLDALAIGEVVVAVDRVDEQDAGLRMVVRARHDLLPQLARPYPAIDPLAVRAPLHRFVAVTTRAGIVHQLP